MKPEEQRNGGPPSWLSIPPGVDHLIVDDGEPLESPRHRDAMNVLIDSLELHWAGRRDFYVGGNMFLYFSMTQTKKNDFRGPDVFVVLGTEHKDRKAWVLWEEDGKRPTVVIELTSESTRAEDHGRKKDVYARALEVPYYFIGDPFTGELEGFRLPQGSNEYRPIEPNRSNRLAVEPLGLELGVWRGGVRFDDVGPWLRWFEPDGTMLETAAERLAREKGRADEEKARADREAERAAALERRIAELERRSRGE